MKGNDMSILSIIINLIWYAFLVWCAWTAFHMLVAVGISVYEWFESRKR